MLAASVLLVRLAMGSKVSQLQFKSSWGTPLGSIGVFIYFSTGFTAMLMGGSFLNYKYLDISHIVSHTRSIGVLLVEIGVGLAVMGILVAIYDDLLEGDPND